MRFLLPAADGGVLCQAPHPPNAPPRSHSNDLVACDSCGRWECRVCLANLWKPNGAAFPPKVINILRDAFESHTGPIALLPYTCVKCAADKGQNLRPFIHQIYQTCQSHHDIFDTLQRQCNEIEDLQEIKDIRDQIAGITGAYVDEEDDAAPTTNPQSPAEDDDEFQEAQENNTLGKDTAIDEEDSGDKGPGTFPKKTHAATTHEERPLSEEQKAQLTRLHQALDVARSQERDRRARAVAVWTTETPEGRAYEITRHLGEGRLKSVISGSFDYLGPPPADIAVYTAHLTRRFMEKFPDQVEALCDVPVGSRAHLIDVVDPVRDSECDSLVLERPDGSANDLSFYLQKGQFRPPQTSTPNAQDGKTVRFRESGGPQAGATQGGPRPALRTTTDDSVRARSEARQDTEIVAGAGLLGPQPTLDDSSSMSTSIHVEDQLDDGPPASPEEGRRTVIGTTGGGSGQDTTGFLKRMTEAAERGKAAATKTATPGSGPGNKDKEAKGQDQGNGTGQGQDRDNGTGQGAAAAHVAGPPAPPAVPATAPLHTTAQGNGTGQGAAAAHVAGPPAPPVIPAHNAPPQAPPAVPPAHANLPTPAAYPQVPAHTAPLPTPAGVPPPGPTTAPLPTPAGVPPPAHASNPLPMSAGVPPPGPMNPPTASLPGHHQQSLGQPGPTNPPLANIPGHLQHNQGQPPQSWALAQTTQQQFDAFVRFQIWMASQQTTTPANASNSGGRVSLAPDSTVPQPPDGGPGNPHFASTPQPPTGGAAGGGGGGGGGGDGDDDDPGDSGRHNRSGRGVPMRGLEPENISTFIPEDGDIGDRGAWLKFYMTNAANEFFDGKDPSLFIPWLARLESRLKHVRASSHEAYELLSAHLRGAPKEMVARIIPTQRDAYRRALRVLQTHYGSITELVRALEAELLAYPVLDGTALNKLEGWLGRLLKIEESVLSIPRCPFKFVDYTRILWTKIHRNVQQPMMNSFYAKAGGATNVSDLEWDFIKTYLLAALEDEKAAAREKQRLARGPHNMALVNADVAEDAPPTATAPSSSGKKKQLSPAERRAATVCGYCGKAGHSSITCRTVPTDAERLAVIRDKGLCGNCLKLHDDGECRGGVCLRCGAKHHTSVHSAFKPGPAQPATPNLVAHVGMKNIIHGTLTLKVSNPVTGYSKVLNVFLDGGSTRSAVTRDVQDMLELESAAEVKLRTSTFHASEPVLVPASKVVAKITSRFSSMSLTVELLAVEQICQDLYVPRMVNNQSFADFLSSLPPNVTNVPPPNDSSFHVDILIGQDLLEAFVGATTRATAFGDYLSAYSSPWGTVLRGAVPGTKPSANASCGMINVLAPDVGKVVQSSRKRAPACRDLESLLERQSDLEPLGWAEGSRRQLQADDEATAALAGTFTRLQDGRLESPLPLGEGTDFLPDNLGMATARSRADHARTPLAQLERQHGKMKELHDSGIIEELFNVDLSPTTGKGVHYLPIFSVPKHGEPDESGHRPMTGVRLVIDASARTHAGFTLNECLTKPPKTFASLFAVMLHGRCYPFAATADFSSAFYSLSVAKEHRDLLRILTPPSPRGPFASKDFRVFRLTRLPMGTTPSPWVLSTALHHILRQAIAGSTPRHGLLVKDLEMVERGTYVDNTILGANSPSDLSRIAVGTQALFKDYQFTLTTFAASPRKALNGIEEKDRLPEGPTAYLGITWVADDRDALRVSNTDFPPAKDLDRASLTSAAHKLYDPFGQVGPLIIALKFLLRRAFDFGDPWDAPASAGVKEEYERLVKDLQDLALFDIPRRMVEDFDRPATLVVYSDANSHAYGFVMYLVQNTKPTFLLSRHRLTPAKRKGTVVTIPRAELWAVGLGTKFAAWTLAELAGRIEVREVVFYSDSAVALYWIRKGSSLRPYEARRVQEILAAKVTTDFRYIPSGENPADHLTKAASMEELHASNFISGPSHIKRPTHLWPDLALPPCDTRLVKGTPRALLKINSLIAATPAPPRPSVTNLIDVARFNSLHKLLHVTALVFRAGNRPLASPDDVVTKAGFRAVSEEEREKALLRWVRMAQSAAFQEELAFLRLADTLTPERFKARKLRVPQVIKQLKVFLDDEGLLRVRGRMANVPALQAEFYPDPLLLPGKNKDGSVDPAILFTRLIASSTHNALAHSGIASTSATMRRKFWVTGAGSLVAGVIRDCYVCSKVFRPPLPRPPLGNLPRARLTPRIAPFTHMVVDQLGPVQTIDDKGAVHKRWVLVAVCAGSRAVHLEPLASYSGTSVVQAFQRLWNRYGVNFGFVYCDNAGAFQSAGVAFSALKDHPTFHSALPKLLAPINNRVKVVFSPARAPWAQGSVEIMVKLTKRSLLPSLHGVHASDETFATILSDVGAALNARPLTALSSSSGDPLPLTPLGIITGHIGAEGFPSSTTDYGAPKKVPKGHNAAKSAVKAFLARSRVMDVWWQRWITEYLPLVRDRHLRQERGHRKASVELKPGAVITIVGPGPRHGWRMGRVLAPCRSPSDNVVRAYWVRASSGVTTRQAAANLIPTELGETKPLVIIPERVDERPEDGTGGQPDHKDNAMELNAMGFEEEAPEEDDEEMEDDAPPLNRIITRSRSRANSLVPN